MKRKKFKKIYVEITNICNMTCPFCSQLKRKEELIEVDKFKIVLDNIKKYTDYIYLHIKGEPLIHPNLEAILALCFDYNIKVNITTNSTLLKQNFTILKNAKAIRQINLSLHSLGFIDEDKQKQYLDEVIGLINYVSENKPFYLSLRFWLGNNHFQNYAKIYIESYFSKQIIASFAPFLPNVYVSFEEEFTWPDENVEKTEFKYCHGIKDHIGILVDGTVVPCCLDGNGVVNLGNIYESSLDEILSSKRYLDMLAAFSTRQMPEELCLMCSFKNKFN